MSAHCRAARYLTQPLTKTAHVPLTLTWSTTVASRRSGRGGGRSWLTKLGDMPPAQYKAQLHPIHTTQTQRFATTPGNETPDGVNHDPM